MVVFSGLFTALSRLVGGVATRTLGWVVLVLYGSVPQSRRTLLSVMALAATLWLIAVLAIVVPSVGDLIASAVPRQPVVQVGWIRPLLIAAVILLPPAVGVMSALLAGVDAQRDAGAVVVSALRGYPFTILLALTIVVLGGWALSRSARAARTGWRSVHLPMMVKPDAYPSVADGVADALRDTGVDIHRGAATGLMVLGPRLLAALGGGGFSLGVPDDLVELTADGLRILVYPSDVAFLGRDELVTPAFAAVARALPTLETYLTTGEATQKLEDRLRDVRRGSSRAVALREVDEELRRLALPNGEWETLLRIRYQTECEAEASRPATGQRA